MRISFIWWLILLAVYCLKAAFCTRLPYQIGDKNQSEVKNFTILERNLPVLNNSVRYFEKPGEQNHKTHFKFRITFEAPQLNKNEQLEAADYLLNIGHILTDIYTKNDSIMLRIFVIDIIKPGKKGHSDSISRIIDSKLINVNDKKDISVDVLPAVQRWLENPKGNHGVLLSLHGLTEKHKKHLRRKRDLEQSIMYTYVDENGTYKQGTASQILESKRTTRMAKKPTRETCRLHQMYVDFAEIGWADWVEAPLGYDAGVCRGECAFPLSAHLKPSNHAILQAMTNLRTPTRVPKPCCVPTQFSSKSLLHKEKNGSVSAKTYPKMIVTACGCR